MQFAILSAPPDVAGCRLIADLSRQTTALSIATNARGLAELQATVAAPSLAAQFRIADRQGLPWCYVGDGSAAALYVGRLEDVTIAGDRLTLGAFGASRALADAPHTALWSDTRTAAWQELPETAPAYAGLTIAPKKFGYDTNGRLYIELTKGTSYVNLDTGAFVYDAPDGGSRLITRLAFDYAFVLPAGSYAYAGAAEADNSSYASAWALLATGGAQSGTVTATLGTPRPRVLIGIQMTTAGSLAAETGAYLLRITNVRVTTATPTIDGGVIASALVAVVTGANPGILSDVTSRIRSPGLDLYQEVYEDQTPSEILERLARLGDTSGQPWRAWVGADRILTFAPWGSGGRTWYVDVTDLQVQRSLDTLATSVYATYQDADGRTRRTAAGASSASTRRYGLTRQQAHRAQTTSATQAAAERDTWLADRATPPARARVSVNAVYTAHGARAPLWAPRAGDTLILRNLAPSLSVDVDKLRVIRLGRTVWDVGANTLSVEPQVPLPTLETMLAQKDNTNAR